MPTQNKKNSFIKKISKLTMGLLLILVGAYLILGFTFDRDFFARDASEKYGRVLGATTLSLRIIGPPGKPVLSTESFCSYAGSPYIRLTWDATQDTDNYSIERDTTPLISGLTETTYDDYAVTSATTYSYVTTAHGPAGQTASDPVVATTNLCNALPDPMIEIDQINEDPIINPQEIIQIEDRTPTFYGHTNINNAIIEIELNSPTPIFAQTTANANGFWEWTVPLTLDFGSHLLEATAIDPLEPSRRESASLVFEITAPPASSDNDDDNDHDKKDRKKKAVVTTVSAPSSTSWPEIKKSFTLALDVLNDDAVVFTGQDLKTRLTIKTQDPAFKQNQTVDYLIVDLNGKVVFQTSSETTVFRDSLVFKNIALPGLLKNGRYKVIAQTDDNGTLVSAENFFRLQEAPLIVAGPVRFTLTELMANMGWVITILFLLLLIFLLLLSIEYWLYKHSVLHIDEHFLAQKGFLGKRKGVLR